MEEQGAAPRVVGLKRLSLYLKRLLESDKSLRGIGVTGEISNLKPFASGLWFSLKEEDAVLTCVAWSDVVERLPELCNGREVTAYGSLTAWPKQGRYQFVVREVVASGMGELHRRYEELKRRLADEGLFDRPKRMLPRYPFRVALVSSPRADGYNDFVTLMRERAPHVRVRLVETSVQGLAAVPEITAAIGKASELDVDVVIVARGGGSAEDIFAFSQEPVVRALARCAHPTISAIGHAKDVPLCDLVADRRAETPSHAAHLLTERTTEDLLEWIAERGERLASGMRRTLQNARRRLSAAIDRSPLVLPERLLETQRQHLADASERAEETISRVLTERRTRADGVLRRLERVDPFRRVERGYTTLEMLGYRLSRIELLAGRRSRLETLVVRLDAAMQRLLERRRSRWELASRGLQAGDPHGILARGYAIVSTEGRVLRDAAEVGIGQAIEVRLARGKLAAHVERREDE